MAGLGQGVDDHLGLAFNNDLPVLAGGVLDGVQPPVLGFEDEQAAAGVENDEIGVRLLGADGDVVPDQVVVIELLLQAFGEALFAGCHAWDAAA